MRVQSTLGDNKRNDSSGRMSITRMILVVQSLYYRVCSTDVDGLVATE